MAGKAEKITIIAHYFPPINSSGAKRMEANAKYFARAGRSVTVVTPIKTGKDGAFSEPVPEGVEVHELTWFGRRGASRSKGQGPAQQVGPPGSRGRRFKDAVMRVFGQLPDPRLPFALGFLNPFLSHETKAALRAANVIIATCPPWPTLLAAIIARWRWGTPVVLDYRDQFSLCHEMPGSSFAKAVELRVDRFLVKRAAAIVTISEPMADYYRCHHSNVSVILNGYDHERLEDARQRTPWRPRAKGTPLTLRYLGIITPGRIPRKLLGAMRNLKSDNHLNKNSMVVEYYGECQVMEQVIESEYSDLRDLFVFFPRVAYDRALELVVSADHLLFCENSISAKVGEEASAAGILTTKLFEYLASGRRIVADISPETLAGTFIRRAGDCHFVSDDATAFADYLASDVFWNPAPCETTPFVHSLSRSCQADEYLIELDSIIDGARRMGRASAIDPVEAPLEGKR